MPFLVWDSPRGRIVGALERSIVIVGSDEVSDFCVRHPGVAPRHALVQVDGEAVKITDLGSGRGTKINGASLVPDLPSTLEPGDFINLGSVVLTFHKTPPPAAARPSLRAVETSRDAFPWKWVAIGLLVLLIVCLGAVVVLSRRDAGGNDQADPKENAAHKEQKKAPTGVTARPAARPEQKSEPAGKPPDTIEAMPPNRYAPVQACPDLLEVKGTGFLPVKLEIWDATSMTAVGADGKRYRFKRGDIQRVVDRADLARRARKRIERQPIDAIKACFELAQWCFLRHIRAPLEPFVRRIVADRPGDPVKRFLAAAIEAEEKGG